MAAAGSSTLGSWGQGSVLTHDHAVALSLLEQGDVAHVAIVITHDCDMIQSSAIEPLVEVLIAGFGVSENSGLRHGKSARSLQMEWIHRDSARLVELSATRKHLLDKQGFEGLLPDSDYKLPKEGLFLLRRWLAVRYFRSAFPDEFNARLKNTKVEEGLLKALKKCRNITAVYLELNVQDELPGNDATPYIIDIVLSYEEGDEPDDMADEVAKVVADIVDLFSRRCLVEKPVKKWSWLQLRRCIPVAEGDLSVARAKRLTRLNLDYISLRGDPPAPTGFGSQG